MQVTKTPNAENPIANGSGTPLLTMDVWEHAYCESLYSGLCAAWSLVACATLFGTVLNCCTWRLQYFVLLTLLAICPTDLDVQNARPKYIQNFLEELISWDVVNKRLAEA